MAKNNKQINREDYTHAIINDKYFEKIFRAIHGYDQNDKSRINKFKYDKHKTQFGV